MDPNAFFLSDCVQCDCLMAIVYHGIQNRNRITSFIGILRTKALLIFSRIWSNEGVWVGKEIEVQPQCLRKTKCVN